MSIKTPKSTTQKLRFSWHPSEDALINSGRKSQPPTPFLEILASINSLPDTPGRTLHAVRNRWTRLKEDQTDGLNEVEQELLKKAVIDVEKKEKWKYVVMRYAELARGIKGVETGTMGVGSAKRIWGEMERKETRKRVTEEGEVKGAGAEEERDSKKAKKENEGQDYKKVKEEFQEEDDYY